jgi:hypothetical protein
MPESLSNLEDDRSELLRQISGLGDFRRGSITPTRGTCGTPTCHCHQPQDPGHGPTWRLTYKVEGKTVTESFATQAALRKAQKEVAEYQRFRELSQELLTVNEKICRLRPLPGELTASGSPQEKKRRRRFKRKSGKK